MPNAIQVSPAITHCLATPVTITDNDIKKGHRYVSLPRNTYQLLFAQTPVRHYVGPNHSYKLDIASRQASGDPFHMPPDSQEQPSTELKPTKNKRTKPSVSDKRRETEDLPPPPPLPYEQGPERLHFWRY